MTNEERAQIMRQARANVVALKSLSQLQTEVVTELPAESERAVADLQREVDRLRAELVSRVSAIEETHSPAEKWGSPEFHKRCKQQEEQSVRRSYEQQEVADPQADHAAWNNWCDQRIADFITQVSETALVPMICGRIAKAKQAAQDELNQLRNEVAELRGEMNVLRELLKAGAKDAARKVLVP
jgi:hypothetical protein